ncbi:Protein TIC 62, chloroplastic [Morella rubra]|uniref:Protein TIC 62, chloroplastic n=1 Tax=Morella rubra TaxID=262757 RepID=A0A6A1V3K3_9ROSI|nr:Protein TIC 62, chloroplastic [Morella rubra]
MERCSLRSSTATTVLSPLFPSGSIEKHSVHGQVLKFPNSKGVPKARKLKFLGIRAQASGTQKVRSEAVEAISKKEDKDEDLVFVAGATGKVGSRTVRELLKLGFRVRAGVRSTQKAETLVQSVKQMKLDVENSSEGTQPNNRLFLVCSPAVEKLEIVECDLEKRDQIGPALGNASVVICCIGASEKEVFDITGPYRIDYLATKNLIDAATIAKVGRFILLTSLGTNKIGFPAALLNLFWGVLIWKRKAEEALLASGLPYAIVRPGGMERPTDAYKETHNVSLSQEDTLFGGQVSNLQVAELMAVMAKNRSLSYCKIVEVIAETTAPLTPMEELLAKIPSQRADISSPKESSGPGGPDSALSKTMKSEEPSTPIKKEPSTAKVMATQPLSPYIVYEDSKPPTSPTPTQSTNAGATKPSYADAKPELPKSTPSLKPSGTEKQPTQTEVKKPKPLSPYTCYDDLRPPVSPTPTPPDGQKNKNVIDAVSKLENPDTQTGAMGTTTTITEIKPAPPEISIKKALSPYVAYEDLKPPSSPSPTPSGHKETPDQVLSPPTGGNNVATTVATTVVEKIPSESSSYHYSPYPVTQTNLVVVMILGNS